MGFKKATIVLSSAAAAKHDTGVKFQMRFSIRTKRSSSLLMVREEKLTAIGAETGSPAHRVEVLLGDGEDYGKLRIGLRTGGENTVARRQNPKRDIFYIPIGYQEEFPNNKLPATSCESIVVEDDETAWLEVTLPQAIKQPVKTELIKRETIDKERELRDKTTRKEMLSRIGRTSV